MASHYSELQEYSKCIVKNYASVIKNRLSTDPSYIEEASVNIVDHLIDDIILEVVAEYHRAVVKGYVDQIFPCKPDENCDPGSLTTALNIGNEQSERKVEDIKCPNCTHPINASRFAAHLQKCMKIGRNSSRIASRRIASNSKESNYTGMSDDEDDEDWNAGVKKNNKILKKLEPKKKKDCTKKANKLGKESKSGKGETRKDECLDWLITPKLQLSPSSANRIRKGMQELDTEVEDKSTTPSPADSNSTSSGSAPRRKDRLKQKGKSKSYKYSEDPDAAVTIH